MIKFVNVGLNMSYHSCNNRYFNKLRKINFYGILSTISGI